MKKHKFLLAGLIISFLFLFFISWLNYNSYIKSDRCEKDGQICNDLGTNIMVVVATPLVAIMQKPLQNILFVIILIASGALIDNKLSTKFKKENEKNI